MKKIVFFLSIVAFAYSCQKEIEVDLNEANPQVVIEANYSAEDSTVRVKLSNTTNYFGNDPVAAINTATITIKDAQGVSSTIPFVSDGLFELNNYIPQYNSTYTLNVVYNGVSFTAQSQLNEVVPLSPTTYEYLPSFFGIEGGYFISVNYNDPPGVENNFLIVLTVNGELQDGLDEIFTHSDELTDGNYNERPLFSGEFFDLQDTIITEFRAIDRPTIDYYEEVISIANSDGSAAAPANPDNNWDNNALGFFSAYSTSRDTVIIL